MRRERRIAVWLSLYAVTTLVTPAQALILHPETDVAPAAGAPLGLPAGSRPDAAVLGRWAGNASTVAIGPNQIITTTHQGGGDGTIVVFAGTEYRVKAGGVHVIGEEDLRVATIETTAGQPANLTQYVGVYSGSNEVNQPAVIGGFGRGRGATLSEDNRAYGYNWDFTANNATQRWGANLIDHADATRLTADYDDLGAPTALPYEAALSEFDSGGGWFIYDNGQWKVAGLSRDVEHFGRSIFRVNQSDPDVIENPNDPDDTSGRDGADLMDAVRLSPYAGLIAAVATPAAVVPEPASTVFFLALAFLPIRRR